MHLHEIVLAGCAMLPIVHGRSIFDWITRKQDDTLLPTQSFAICAEDQPAERLPHTIGLSYEATLSRPAEIATLDVYVKASAPTEEEALKEAGKAADSLSSWLSDVSYEVPDTPVESWKQYPARVETGYGEDEYEDWTNFDFEGLEISRIGEWVESTEEYLEEKKPQGNKKAKARFSVRMNRPGAVAEFKKEITTKLPVRIESRTGKVTSYDVRVNRIRWSLTDASKAKLKKELRTKALREAIAEGQDYADLYEMSNVRPSECVEEYTWIGEKYDWDYDWDESNVEPKEIEGTTTMKCKFRMTDAEWIDRGRWGFVKQSD